MLGPLAYLDPGTGSLFLQILLGGVAGLLVILKLFWRRMLAFFGIRRAADEKTPVPSEQKVSADVRE